MHTALSPYVVTRFSECFNHFVAVAGAPVGSGWSRLPGESRAHSKEPPHHAHAGSGRPPISLSAAAAEKRQTPTAPQANHTSRLFSGD
jgi:hypothetical protein